MSMIRDDHDERHINIIGTTTTIGLAIQIQAQRETQRVIFVRNLRFN